MKDIYFENVIKKFKQKENIHKGHNLFKSFYEKESGIKFPKNINFSFLKNVIPIYVNDKFNDKQDLIFEDVYKSNIFIGLLEKFNSLNNRFTYFKCIDIFNLMPLFFKENESYNELIKNEKDLFIFKFGFSKNDAFKNLMNCFCDLSYKESYNEDLNDLTTFFKEKIKNHNEIGGYYCKTDETESWALMILNSDILDNNTIKHEMIHYFQDVTGQSIINNENNILLKNEFDTFNLIPKNLIGKIFNSREIIPYFNSFCYILEDNGVKNENEALNILRKFEKYGFSNIDKYVKHCKSLKEYKWFNKRPFVINMIILCKIYDQFIEEIDNHVIKFFKK